MKNKITYEEALQLLANIKEWVIDLNVNINCLDLEELASDIDNILGDIPNINGEWDR